MKKSINFILIKKYRVWYWYVKPNKILPSQKYSNSRVKHYNGIVRVQNIMIVPCTVQQNTNQNVSKYYDCTLQ